MTTVPRLTDDDRLRMALRRVSVVCPGQTDGVIRNHIDRLRDELAEARQIILQFVSAHGPNGWDHSALFMALCRAKGDVVEHESPALMPGGGRE